MRLVVLVLSAVVVACSGFHAEEQWAAPMAEVVFPDHTRVHVEIADTDAKRQRGLMFRKALAPNEGMIFLFDHPDYYPFWMQNCLISLDMLWLDEHARVVSIAHSAPPCRLPDCPPPCPSFDCPNIPPDPGTMASYVVEVMAGFAKQHKVQVGDMLTLKGITQKGE